MAQAHRRLPPSQRLRGQGQDVGSPVLLPARGTGQVRRIRHGRLLMCPRCLSTAHDICMAGYTEGEGWAEENRVYGDFFHRGIPLPRYKDEIRHDAVEEVV